MTLAEGVTLRRGGRTTTVTNARTVRVCGLCGLHLFALVVYGADRYYRRHEGAFWACTECGSEGTRPKWAVVDNL